jgi:hypothetical protein
VHHSLSEELNIPAGAYSIKVDGNTANQYGVKFDITTESLSRKYFDEINMRFVRLGYKECRRSSVPSWQDLPGTNDGNKWMVAMFENRERANFALVRVMQSSVTGTRTVSQHFIVAVQHVVKPNEGNIAEFCGK